MSWILWSAEYLLCRDSKRPGTDLSTNDHRTYSKVAFAKLYNRKTPITAADLLNDRVLSFFEEHEIALSRMLTDRGTQYCGSDGHEYELYLALEDIDHTRTKAKSPQTNRICERFHTTVLNSTGSHFVKRSTQQSKNFKAIWTPGLSCTMKKDLIRSILLWENSVADLCRHTALAKEKMIAA